jgi:hypothetical protein
MTTEDPADVLELLQKVQERIARHSIFNNPLELLPRIEYEYKISPAAAGIVNNPHHRCMENTCSMRGLPVRIMRITGVVTGGTGVACDPRENAGRELMVINTRPASPPDDDDLSAEERARVERMNFFAAPFMNERVHICLEDTCEHLHHPRPGVCLLRGACPHAVSYPASDQYEFRDLFACDQSGNLHACGAFCRQRFSTLGGGGRHTCPLTGIDLGSELDRDMFGPNAQPFLALGYGDCDIAPTGDNECRRDIHPLLQQEQITLHYHRIVRTVFLEIMMSDTRQRYEFETLMHSHERLRAELMKIVKKKKPHPNLVSPVMARAIWTAMRMRPAGPYFRVFHVTDSMLPSVAARLGRFAASCSRRQELHPSTREHLLRNTLRVRALVMGRGEQAPPVPPLVEQPMATMQVPVAQVSSDKGWIPRMSETADLVARVVVRVYQLLEKHVRGLDANKPFPSFKTLFVPIMYIMKIGHRVPSSLKSRGNLDDSCTVCVIPRMDIMGFLPHETMLPLFPSVVKHAQSNRSMVDIRTEIMSMYAALIRAGSIFDVQVELHELVGESPT